MRLFEDKIEIITFDYGAIMVPTDIQDCPYCGDNVDIQVEDWTEESPGVWIAESGSLSCSAEPEIDSQKWEEHQNEHSYMPYVHWLPAETKVIQWLNSKYRFMKDPETNASWIKWPKSLKTKQTIG